MYKAIIVTCLVILTITSVVISVLAYKVFNASNNNTLELVPVCNSFAKGWCDWFEKESLLKDNQDVLELCTESNFTITNVTIQGYLCKGK